MKKHLVAIALASALAFAAGVEAQPKNRPQGQMMEAVVTVTKVDPATRTASVRTPTGETLVQLPPDMNIDQIQPGARYRVRYAEPVAVAIAPGAPTSPTSGATAVIEPRRDATAGLGVKVEEVSGVVEAIDPAGQRIAVRTLNGGRQAFAVAADTAIGGPIKPGDAVTVAYHQVIATHMVSTPQPERDPAPAQ
jgi:hypothetical protein